jgi:hypothetical protein
MARVDVGLSYLEDRTPSGRPLGGDRVKDAIGWVILKVCYSQSMFLGRSQTLLIVPGRSRWG